MSVDDAITVLIDKWDDWRAESDNEAQHQQDPRAGELVMREKLRPLLQRVLSGETYCTKCNGLGHVPDFKLGHMETCERCGGTGAQP